MSTVIKVAGAAIAASCAALAALPFLAGGGDAAGPMNPHACGPLAVILDTIRSVESGGDYRVTITTSSASGAYAFIDSSWRHYGALAGVDVDRYPRAYLAPEPGQDAAATVYVTEVLDVYNDDVAVIPVAWYLPSAINNPDRMDVIPPMGGNVLTPREYQTKWLGIYEQKLAAAGDPATASSCAAGTAGPSGPVSTDGRWALPAPRDVITEPSLDDPHSDYPAWDFLVAEGTPIYAITDGVVVTTQYWNGTGGGPAAASPALRQRATRAATGSPSKPATGCATPTATTCASTSATATPSSPASTSPTPATPAAPAPPTCTSSCASTGVNTAPNRSSPPSTTTRPYRHRPACPQPAAPSNRARRTRHDHHPSVR